MFIDTYKLQINSKTTHSLTKNNMLSNSNNNKNYHGYGKSNRGRGRGRGGRGGNFGSQRNNMMMRKNKNLELSTINPLLSDNKSGINVKNENIQKQNNYNGLRETSSLRMRKEVRLNRHSTQNLSDVSVFAIQGQPQIKMDWKIFWWAFLVHFTYPLGTLYVYFVDGSRCFYNMRLGTGGFMQISFTHVLFLLPIIALVWMLADESAKSQYQWEIIVLWFSHFSRLIGIAVKYSHLNKYTFHQFKNADMGEAQVIQANMMLPSGWFEPQLERWFHHLDDAEHLTNRTIGLHTLTLAHGLKQPMTYVGEVSVSKIKELIQPLVNNEQVKKEEWTIFEKVKRTVNGDEVPVIEVSAGLILLSFLSSKDMSASHITFPRTLLNSAIFGLLSATIGIWYRMAKGLPGGGTHNASGFFIFTIVYCTFWNFWSFCTFLECAVIDSQRRYLLRKKLTDQLICKVSDDGLFHILPKLINLRQGTNASTYIAMRQAIKSLGKDFRLRLQWIVSYCLFLCLIFMLSFFTLVGKKNKTFKEPQWYALYFLLSFGPCYILRALYWADKANSITSDVELRQFEIQIMQAHVEMNVTLRNSIDGKNKATLKIEQNTISFLRECTKFIARDDHLKPIRIVGVRADWKLLRGVVATILAFLITFAEFVGLEALGIEGVGGD